MAIVRNITRRVEVPHEPGASMVFRTLTWKQLEAARKAQSDKAREEAKAFGADFIKALNTGDVQKTKDALRALDYDVRQFDRDTLLMAAIASWSGPSYDGILPSEGIGELDEVTSVWAAEQAIAGSRPKTEDETKNS